MGKHQHSKDIRLFNRAIIRQWRPEDENLTKYRLAYYYGTKIVEELNKSYCLEEILKLDYIVLRKCIYSYFNLKDI